MPIVCVSGGMDPLHEGHVRLIHDAATHGDVIVILNSDEWLMRKKGYVFMPWLSRAYILRSIKGVKDVVPVDDADGTVCEALYRIRPDFFANGGDRVADNTPELRLCTDLGIKAIFNVGGQKIASSSEIVDALRS
jgi:cytidyltransferase-like protein